MKEGPWPIHVHLLPLPHGCLSPDSSEHRRHLSPSCWVYSSGLVMSHQDVWGQIAPGTKVFSPFEDLPPHPHSHYPYSSQPSVVRWWWAKMRQAISGPRLLQSSGSPDPKSSFLSHLEQTKGKTLKWPLGRSNHYVEENPWLTWDSLPGLLGEGENSSIMFGLLHQGLANIPCKGWDNKHFRLCSLPTFFFVFYQSFKKAKLFLTPRLCIHKQPGWTWPLVYSLYPLPCSSQPSHPSVWHLLKKFSALKTEIRGPNCVCFLSIVIALPLGSPLLVISLCLPLGLMEAPKHPANQKPHVLVPLRTSFSAWPQSL